jgi:hypothetical protein
MSYRAASTVPVYRHFFITFISLDRLAALSAWAPAFPAIVNVGAIIAGELVLLEELLLGPLLLILNLKLLLA